MKPLSKLPLNADLTHKSWSYGFPSTSATGFIRHCDEDGNLTEYELPFIVCQIIVEIREHAKFSIREGIWNALGIPTPEPIDD